MYMIWLKLLYLLPIRASLLKHATKHQGLSADSMPQNMHKTAEYLRKFPADNINKV